MLRVEFDNREALEKLWSEIHDIEEVLNVMQDIPDESEDGEAGFFLRQRDNFVDSVDAHNCNNPHLAVSLPEFNFNLESLEVMRSQILKHLNEAVCRLTKKYGEFKNKDDCGFPCAKKVLQIRLDAKRIDNSDLILLIRFERGITGKIPLSAISPTDKVVKDKIEEMSSPKGASLLRNLFDKWNGRTFCQE